MTRDEKHIARLLFKNKVYESDKQSYEDFFIRVMQNYNANFEPVKPQGKYGDRKNDGFDKTKGVYYQVYAPEDLPSKEGDAIKKLIADFDGLQKYWSKRGFSIKEFYYVVNDKYKGNYPTLIADVYNISQRNNITAELFRNKNLEELFLGMDDQKIIDIIGFLPDTMDIQEPDYSIMTEVIKYTLQSEVNDSCEKIPDDPNFDNKINFNSLSKSVSEYLNAGRRQAYVISEYFSLQSNFVKDDLRKSFSSIYQKGISEIPESETKNDELFFYIRNQASPRNNVAVHNAVYILMAYYFEYCDIFETPEIKNLTLFE
ncbi:ABC-three component system protein [Draconibacterium mangrovi]|uniref:ABC-three component system protein n=1 Tax=Draconibacterium mangrovi TaxID=2697469 RepID=UPI0013D64A81|nr:ABC-three component system protein [Draconibacterium mangrovi]